MPRRFTLDIYTAMLKTIEDELEKNDKAAAQRKADMLAGWIKDDIAAYECQILRSVRIGEAKKEKDKS